MILGIVRQNFQVLEMGEYLYKLLPKFCDFKIISLSGLRARTCVPKNGVLGRQIRKKDKLWKNSSFKCYAKLKQLYL